MTSLEYVQKFQEWDGELKAAVQKFVEKLQKRVAKKLKMNLYAYIENE